MTFTDKDKYEAVCRELKYRKKCYPRWVATKRMRQDDADYQIAIFMAIAADYREGF